MLTPDNLYSIQLNILRTPEDTLLLSHSCEYTIALIYNTSVEKCNWNKNSRNQLLFFDLFYNYYAKY